MAQMKKAGRREAGANNVGRAFEGLGGIDPGEWHAAHLDQGYRRQGRHEPGDGALPIRRQGRAHEGGSRPRIEQLLESVPENGGFEETLFALVVWMRDNAWLAMLMMQSVYAGDELRTHFETQHAPRLVRLYQGALERGRAANQARDDLDPRFAVSALISLLVFPNLAGPTLGRVLGIGRGTAAARRYTGELLKLFKYLVSVRKVIESYE